VQRNSLILKQNSQASSPSTERFTTIFADILVSLANKTYDALFSVFNKKDDSKPSHQKTKNSSSKAKLAKLQ